jgi:hypothetical protein
MDYSIMKAVQFVLFFGAVFAFGFWQLHSLKMLRKQRGKDDNQPGISRSPEAP